MHQKDRAAAFAALHQEPTPLILHNVWDAGSARAVARSGALAIATSSWAVAAAQGYEDGEAMPVDIAEQITRRIVASVDLPVSADIEGGYGESPEEVASTLLRFIEAGVVGVNFEDRRIGREGLHDLTAQADRIAALRQAADETGVPVFINARTDVFFGGAGDIPHDRLMDQAVERAEAYAAAGANGFFVPGLVASDLIGVLCERTSLPINIMVTKDMPPVRELANLGVRRISFGPSLYLEAMGAVTAKAGA
ncbi:isocitrate lyase/PEP mutase family protein [Parvularcula maris]|uniref:Isocitrate lyase/phosphoenolpyruvate mutase family protein n=1 Tax=Parvularcula maris TaxID=2965077 RepID=A0A9X2RGJ8_9PROT|nr:isocitrate lyase/phosphoenolpyruvate mutase family protein [Parvularcula maris]MCQ8184050.1 isocitrate lyase/phosphoenolpyruvate mutase family protein [Parvularcula maris]